MMIYLIGAGGGSNANIILLSIVALSRKIAKSPGSPQEVPQEVSRKSFLSCYRTRSNTSEKVIVKWDTLEKVIVKFEP